MTKTLTQDDFEVLADTIINLLSKLHLFASSSLETHLITLSK